MRSFPIATAACAILLLVCLCFGSPITPIPTADSCTQNTAAGTVTCLNPRWAAGGPVIDWCIWNTATQDDCEGGPVLWCAYMKFGPLSNSTIVQTNTPTAYPYGGLGSCPCGSVTSVTCSLSCHAPIPTAQPLTPSPTLPPNNQPYLRFGNAIPSGNFVDAVVTQTTQKSTNITYTWSNYGFAQFSGWVETFEIGSGLIQIYQNNGGSRGELLVQTMIPLTPGPLVVVVKDYWPPKTERNIETIAAAYAPPTAPNSGVRLFNLSPDTQQAGLEFNSKVVVNDIDYSTSSVWVKVPQDVKATFTAFDSSSNKALASIAYTPPSAPFVFTSFLVGVQSEQAYGTRIVPLVDAPEH